MRRIRYSVAASLDGFITDAKGGADWIPMDPDIDFGALFAQFDTLLMGRRTFEATVHQQGPDMPGMRVIVVSRTLQERDYPNVTVVRDDIAQVVGRLRAEPGKDIWLFGGGVLFRALLAANLVDTVEVAVVPVLLGAGTPLLPSPAAGARLKLTRHTVYPKTGIVLLEYDVASARESASA